VHSFWDDFCFIVIGGAKEGACGLAVGTARGVTGVVRGAVIEPFLFCEDLMAVGYILAFEPELAPYYENYSVISSAIEEQGLDGFVLSVADNLAQTITLQNFARAINTAAETGDSSAIAEEYVNIAVLLLPFKIKGQAVDVRFPPNSLHIPTPAYNIMAQGEQLVMSATYPITVRVPQLVVVNGQALILKTGTVLMAAGAVGAGGPGGLPPEPEPVDTPEPTPRPGGRVVTRKIQHSKASAEWQKKCCNSRYELDNPADQERFDAGDRVTVKIDEVESPHVPGVHFDGVALDYDAAGHVVMPPAGSSARTPGIKYIEAKWGYLDGIIPEGDTFVFSNEPPGTFFSEDIRAEALRQLPAAGGAPIEHMANTYKLEQAIRNLFHDDDLLREALETGKLRVVNGGL